MGDWAEKEKGRGGLHGLRREVLAVRDSPCSRIVLTHISTILTRRLYVENVAAFRMCIQEAILACNVVLGDWTENGRVDLWGAFF